MIKISPAILTNNESEFTRQINAYAKFAEQIDIDINLPNDDFVGDFTVGIDFASKEIKLAHHLCALHLMVTDPYDCIVRVQELLPDYQGIFYVHQEANYAPCLKFNNIRITVKAESTMREIEFYQQFAEVQLMTIATGKQGNAFQPEILERIIWLREQGYRGKISIDGGVNLQTAHDIRKYDLDRVSVGSFFSHSNNPASDFAILNNALNG